jgi:hypothetical protein
MEALEHAEHASHAAHSHDTGKAPAKLIGLTMALIGVMIAFCAAMVGGERNELTRTLIEQTQANADASSASIKFRIIMLDLEQLRGSSTPASIDSPSPMLRRFVRLYSDYAQERQLSKNWAGSYDLLVKAHFESAEGYEHAQLIAEIGIVLASLGVLLSSRPPWLLSLVLAAVCVFQLGRTYVHARHEVDEGMARVQQGEEAYKELRKAHTSSNDDELTVEALDPGGRIRASFKEGAEHGAQPAEPKTEAPAEHEKH